ncbi:MAG: uracil-DNA glycosylase family protein [Alphaproteobacteria bacterium]
MPPSPGVDREFEHLLAEIRRCRICAEHLPLGPRPVLRLSPQARVLIVGQAPGTKVHDTGLPWNDRSGDRLREWLWLDRESFYDASRVGILPMGLCYPGRDARGGDKPPRPECGPQWHPQVRPRMTRVELTLLVGRYAQAYYLGKRRKRNLTETVAAWREYLPDLLPMPHPSWRTTAWQKRNAWFETKLLPELRRRVHALM